MLDPKILEKLKSHEGEYLLRKPEVVNNIRKTEKSKDDIISVHEQALKKFQSTLLSVNSQRLSNTSNLDRPQAKRKLLKSLKGGPLQPIAIKDSNHQKIKPQLDQSITQSLPVLRNASLHQRQQALPVSQVEEHKEEKKTEEEKEVLVGEQDPINPIKCKVEQYFNDQEALVMHLTGKCICMQCPCGKCKCRYSQAPIAQNLRYNSSYRTEFREQPIQEQDLKVDSNKFDKFKSVKPCDYKTTSQDYKAYTIPPAEITAKKQFTPAYGQTPMSSYKNFYMDYGDLHYEQFKVSHYRTVIPELPFMGHTTYGNNFKFKEKSETTLQRPPNGKPFPTIDLFLGQSTNQTAYQAKPIMRQKPAEIVDVLYYIYLANGLVACI